MRLDAAIALLLAVFASAGASSSNDQIRQDNAKNVLLVIIDDCRAHLVTDCAEGGDCLLYTSPSPRDGLLSRMPSSA